VRIAWLTQGLSGYLDACFRALHAHGDEQLLVYPQTMSDTAFDGRSFGDYAQTLAWTEPPDDEELLRALRGFAPDAIVMGSWAWPASYRAAMKAQSPGVVRVLAMDNQWRGKPKQWLGRLAHRVYIDPLFDCVMVPSDRTEWFARRLGFVPAQVIRGSYVADTTRFDRGPRSGPKLAANRRFLFAGRLIADKAPDVLAAAYRAYRAAVEEPWELHVAGTGELGGSLDGLPGVRMHGFVQPDRLAVLMHEASCFVLPSRFEPYGVVVHEAAAAGLPLLVSDVAGAVPGLVQDGANGWTVPSERADLWAEAMRRMSACAPDRLGEMSTVSRALASRLSPSIWARNLHEELERRAAMLR
jgi:glycosyltransferase involved in cell wall biosynthesis